jgi:hypothetical protein
MLVAIVVMMVVIETVLLVVMMIAMVFGTLTKSPGPRHPYDPVNFHSSPSHPKHPFR